MGWRSLGPAQAERPVGEFLLDLSEDRDSDTINAGIFDEKSAPDMFAWDISGGIQKKWWDLGNATLWGGYTNSDDGIGGFVSPLFGANPGRSLRANSIPGIGITTEVTGSEVTKWYLAADQSIDSAALDLYIGYQHITPEIDRCSPWCGASSPATSLPRRVLRDRRPAPTD